jgi:hypothetical protein
MHAKPSYMDIPHHAISNGIWYTTCFFTVKDICPLEDGIPEVWLRSPKQL